MSQLSTNRHLRWSLLALPVAGVLVLAGCSGSGDGGSTEDPAATGFSMMVPQSNDADDFYAQVIHPDICDEDRHVARRAYAGLLWGKQLYRYDVEQWLHGDPTATPAPDERRAKGGRNTAWGWMSLADVISMPDEWEYPWFAPGIWLFTRSRWPTWTRTSPRNSWC
jgi:hypothetical protein